MVQVQGSWFPIIDRKPQTRVAEHLPGEGVDFKPQTHRIGGRRLAGIESGDQTVAP